MVGAGCHEVIAMSSREWPFKLSDAKRLAQAAMDLGLTVSGFHFNPTDGSLHIETVPRPAKSDDRPNSFDQVLG
jgi:hypothetical protein